MVDKGFITEGTFDIPSNKNFPGVSCKWKVESADSLIDVITVVPNVVTKLTRDIMESLFEYKKRDLAVMRDIESSLVKN